MCCARALLLRGWMVRIQDAPAPRVPRVALNMITVGVINDLFAFTPLMWTRAFGVTGRRVRWAPGEETVAVDDPTVVVAGADLHAQLLERVAATPGCRIAQPYAEGWVIRARGGDAAAKPNGRQWGERKILFAELPTAETLQDMYMEATPQGWVCLFPCAPRTVAVQAMVASVAEDSRAQLAAMLERMCSVGPSFAAPDPGPIVLDAAPRLARELCGANWFAAGEEAMRLDPVSGDGTGYAVRAAILAAAAADGIENGLPASLVYRHYRARLQSTFLAHLRACASIYGSAGFDASWDRERRATAAGISAVTRATAGQLPSGLRLHGLQLVPEARNE